MPHIEKTSRSLIKTITYRVIIIIFNGLVVFWFTRDIRLTFDVSMVLAVANTLLYFLHERAWNSITWGKYSKKP